MHSDGLSASTIRACHALLSGCLKKAAIERVIDINPCEGTENLPEIEAQDLSEKIITIPEIMALADAVPGQYRLMILLGGFCGLRWGEIAFLTNEHVGGVLPDDDLDGLPEGVTRLARKRTAPRVPYLEVKGTVSEVPGQGVISGPPKTDASYRKVSLSPFLVEEIQTHIERYGLGDGGLLFSDSQGGPLRHRNWRRRVFLPAAKAALGRHYRFHWLRHSCVSNSLTEGLGRNDVGMKLISRRVGHGSIDVTMDIYGGLLEGADAPIADVLEGAYRNWQAEQS
jgi:integrase